MNKVKATWTAESLAFRASARGRVKSVQAYCAFAMAIMATTQARSCRPRRAVRWPISSDLVLSPAIGRPSAEPIDCRATGRVTILRTGAAGQGLPARIEIPHHVVHDVADGAGLALGDRPVRFAIVRALPVSQRGGRKAGAAAPDEAGPLRDPDAGRERPVG